MFKVISKWILNKRQYKYISSSYTIINKTFTNQIPDLKTFMKNQAQVTNNDNKDNKNNNINCFYAIKRGNFKNQYMC